MELSENKNTVSSLKESSNLQNLLHELEKDNHIKNEHKAKVLYYKEVLFMEILKLKILYKIITLDNEIDNLLKVMSLARIRCKEDKKFLITLKLEYKDKVSRLKLLEKKFLML